MVETLHYIVDESGERTSVLVPLKVWEEINQNYKKLKNKLSVFTSIQAGLNEVKKAAAEGKQLQSLSDFLS